VSRAVRGSGWLVLVWFQSGSNPDLLPIKTERYYFRERQHTGLVRALPAGASAKTLLRP